MATIYIDCYHREPHSEALTGIDFTVVYKPGAHAQVSVVEMLPISASTHDHALRAELRLIGEAIVQAARSPQGIIQQPFPGR
jgi:hypothetical protein